MQHAWDAASSLLRQQRLVGPVARSCQQLRSTRRGTSCGTTREPKGRQRRKLRVTLRRWLAPILMLALMARMAMAVLSRHLLMLMSLVQIQAKILAAAMHWA